MLSFIIIQVGNTDQQPPRVVLSTTRVVMRQERILIIGLAVMFLVVQLCEFQIPPMEWAFGRTRLNDASTWALESSLTTLWKQKVSIFIHQCCQLCMFKSLKVRSSGSKILSILSLPPFILSIFGNQKSV